MSELGQGTIIPNEEQAAAVKRLEQLIHRHRELKRIILVINAEILKTDGELWNHLNWMGLQGWEHKIIIDWRSGE